MIVLNKKYVDKFVCGLKNFYLTEILKKSYKLINQKSQQMSQANFLRYFVQFFQSLGYRIFQPNHLFTGITIAQFLCSIKNTHILPSDIAKDEDIRGGALKNFKLIVAQIERYNREQFGIKDYEIKFDVNEIFIGMDHQQLKKMLKECFIIATRAPNSSYFIQKILALDQNAQLLFAQLIKQDRNYISSPTHNNSQAINNSKQNLRQQALDLIDKLYESELQNQKLTSELKKYQSQNAQMRETIIDLYSQLQSVKCYNQNLKRDLNDNNQLILKLRNKKQKQSEKQNKNDQCRKQLQNLLNAYKQEIDMVNLQAEVSRRRYQSKISQLESIIHLEKQNNLRMREQLQYYQNKFQIIIKNSERTQVQLLEITKQYKKMLTQNQKLMESQTGLKFQINYKNLQIQELKQLIVSNNNDDRQQSINSNINSNINVSNVNVKNVVNQQSFHNNGQYNNEKHLLANQFSSTHASPSQNLRNSSSISKNQTDNEQINILKNEIKQLKKQNQKYKGIKNKMKELQYEKNKLLKILNQYQTSRGQQNDIITGCLYELYGKINNKAIITSQNNKSNILKSDSSRATLDQQLTT